MENIDRKNELKKQVGQLMKICHTGTSEDIDAVFKNGSNLALFKDRDNKLLFNYVEKYPEKTPYILNQLKANVGFISNSDKDLLFRVLSTDNITVFNHLVDYLGADNIYQIYYHNKNILSLARQASAKKITLHLIEHIPSDILKNAEKKIEQSLNEGTYLNSSRVQFERSDINSLGSYITNTQGSSSMNYALDIIDKTLKRYKKEGILPNWHFVYAVSKHLKYTNFDIQETFFKPFKDELSSQYEYIQKSIDAIQYNQSDNNLINLIYTFKDLATEGYLKIKFDTYGDKSYEKQKPELLELIKVYPLLLWKSDAFKINKAKHVDIFIQAINQPGPIGEFEGQFSYMLLKNSKLEQDKFNQFIHAIKLKNELFNDKVIHSFATQLISQNKATEVNFKNFGQTLKMISQHSDKKEQFQKLFYDLLIYTQHENKDYKKENLIGVLDNIIQCYPDIIYGKEQFSFPHKKTPKEYHFVSFAIQSNNPSLCQYLLNKIDLKKIDEEYVIDIRRAIFRVSNKEEFQPLYEKFYLENSMKTEENTPKKTMKI